jgi:hypothetical protein
MAGSVPSDREPPHIMTDAYVWEPLGHVDPPADENRLIFYLGPNHYPAGIYLPQGYDLECRVGDTPDWTILRARDSLSGQVLTLWAVRGGELEQGAEAVRVLDP